MDVRQLRCFIAVAEELHFGRAAERLGLAPPALSRQISSLEEELGAVLLTRTTRQVALTRAGLTMLDEAKGIVRGQCITAVQLSADKQSKLKDTLQKKAGTDIELTFAVDKDILGGMVLKMGDRVLDASLRAQLGILRETFKRGE